VVFKARGRFGKLFKAKSNVGKACVAAMLNNGLANYQTQNIAWQYLYFIRKYYERAVGADADFMLPWAADDFETLHNDHGGAAGEVTLCGTCSNIRDDTVQWHVLLMRGTGLLPDLNVAVLDHYSHACGHAWCVNLFHLVMATVAENNAREACFRSFKPESHRRCDDHQ
jgi:hypothetical protein